MSDERMGASRTHTHRGPELVSQQVLDGRGTTDIASADRQDGRHYGTAPEFNLLDLRVAGWPLRRSTIDKMRRATHRPLDECFEMRGRSLLAWRSAVGHCGAPTQRPQGAPGARHRP